MVKFNEMKSWPLFSSVQLLYAEKEIVGEKSRNSIHVFCSGQKAKEVERTMVSSHGTICLCWEVCPSEEFSTPSANTDVVIAGADE
eukprot:scaffold7925_cov101-Cylindrotheca_fusiformis.AAC.2